MTPVERWRRMTNPQTVEDYGLSVTLEELYETPEGREIIYGEINPSLPLRYETEGSTK